jgi:hypothetical protein
MDELRMGITSDIRNLENVRSTLTMIVLEDKMQLKGSRSAIPLRFQSEWTEKLQFYLASPRCLLLTIGILHLLVLLFCAVDYYVLRWC